MWSQSKKPTYYIIPIKWHSGKGKTLERIKISVFVRGLGRGGDGWIADIQWFLGQWNKPVWYCVEHNIMCLSKLVEIYST